MALNPSTQDKRGIVLENSDGSFDSKFPLGDKFDTGVTGGGQLPVGYYAPSVMNMTRVLPRPDNEVNTYEATHNAHPDMEYKIPLAVQGGTWIWKIRVNQAPATASIGNNWGDTDYGVVRWTPTTSDLGNNTFDIDVIDQEGNTLNFTWTVNVNTNWCKFVTSAANGGSNVNDGSEANPYETVDYAISQCSSGETIVLVGNYTFASVASQVTLSTSGCNGIIGYPGDSPTLNMDAPSDGGFGGVFVLGADGFYTQNVIYDNLTSSQNNPRYFATLNAYNRITQYECTFDNASTGVLGNDNVSCLFLGAGATVRRYITIIGNSYNRLPSSSNGFSVVDGYLTEYLVFDQNTFDVSDGVDPSYGVWMKGGNNKYWSIRGNESLNEWGFSAAQFEITLDSAGASGSQGYVEIAYNNIKTEGYNSTQLFSGGSPAIGLFRTNSTEAKNPVWMRRNTIQGAVFMWGRTFDASLESSGDVIVWDGAIPETHKIGVWDQSQGNWGQLSNYSNYTVDVLNSELHGETTDGYIDQTTGLLTGTARDNYRYQRGHEIGGFDVLWKLDEGHFISAKMPLAVIYPRPDVETQSHARHRVFHSSMPYRIPIGVQGGAWPFKYEIIDAPTGATIGQHYGDDDYGILHWVPSGETGTQSFTVRITDQDYNTIDVTWSSTLDDSAFVFIQDGYAGTQVGTISQPLEDYSDYYLNDSSDSTYADKVIVFRGGNYSVIGDAGQNGNVEMNSGTKSPSHIGYPGETAVLDFSTAKIFSRGGTSTADITVIGLTLQNSRTDVANEHFFWLTGSGTDRATFAENTFANMTSGTAGTDNTTTVFLSDISRLKNNFLYKQNILDNIDTGAANGSYVDLYYVEYALIEENYAKNSNNGHGFWAKGSTKFVTVRANEAWENIADGGIEVGYGSESPELPHDHEVCWNRVVFPAGNTSINTILWSGSNAYQGQFYNSFIYRNTFVNGSAWIRFNGAENYVVEANVVVSDMSSRWNTSIMDQTTPNIFGAESDGITDSNGVLQGSYRTNNLGTRGHEVA